MIRGQPKTLPRRTLFPYTTLFRSYLSEKYPSVITNDNLFVASNVCPSLMLSAEIANLTYGECLKKGEHMIAFRGTKEQFDNNAFEKETETEAEIISFDRLYHIFMQNDKAIYEDFKLLTEGRESEPISDSVRVIGNPYFEDGTPKIFIEKGATAECVIFNVKSGPIYIGKDVEIQEGSAIRGPFAACEHAAVNMNTKIYPPTTLGPYCKVGGELNNVVMFGYANKAHEGFLGNAVIGEWCNLGAGTNASNLKNNYAEIRLWDYTTQSFPKTGLQFCGLIMGDHSKAGINSMFNTATVTGVGVNSYGSGFPRTYIPSFSEGGAAGFDNVTLKRFYDGASRMMARRGKELTDADKRIYEHIYEKTMIEKGIK